HEKAITPRVAAEEKERQDRIAKAQAALKAYEQSLPQRLADWEKKQASNVEWVVLQPKALQAANKAKLTKLDDGSIYAEGPNGKGNYVVTADTDLTGITAIRLEALADERLPKGGPGRAPDGNFVLNQISLSVKSKKDLAQTKPILLHQAKADFSQDNFAVA